MSANNPFKLAEIDSTTIDFTANPDGSFTGGVLLDPALGNLIFVGPGGLRVAMPSLADLTDTSLPAPANGQVLQFDGTNWTAATLGGTESTAVGDTDTVNLTMTGTTITADVILDPNPLNILSESAAGVLAVLGSVGGHTDVDLTTAPTNGQALAWDGTNWVPTTFADTDTTYTVNDTDTVDMTLTGTVITADVILDPNPLNILSESAAGLLVTAPALSIDGLTDVDTTTTAPGTGQVLAWDGTNWVPTAPATAGSEATTVGDTDTVNLTLTGTNITADVLLDTVAAGNALVSGPNGLFVPTVTDTDTTYSEADTTSVNMVLTGTVFSANVLVDPAATNALISGPNGLSVTLPADTDTTYTVSDTDTVDLTLTGTGITAAVIVDGVAPVNWLTANANGLLVAPVGIDALTDVDTSTTAPTANQILSWDGTNFVPADAPAGNTSQLVHGGDATTIAGLVDANGNVLALGAIVPDGQLIHYVTDSAGAIANQNAIVYDTCCVTIERCDSANGNAKVIGLLKVDGGTIVETTYLNEDLTPFTGTVANLVVCDSSLSSLSDVAPVAGTAGQVLTWNGTAWTPITPTITGIGNTETVGLSLAGGVLTANAILDPAADNLLTSSPTGLKVVASSNTSALLHGSDSAPIAGLLDGNGTAIALGDPIPDGHIVHYVVDGAGVLVSQNAVVYDDCCVTLERCDSANGNAKVIAIAKLNGNTVVSTAYLNEDLTPFTGDVADLVVCDAGAASVGDLTDTDVTTVAPVSGDRLAFDGTNWVPVQDLEYDQHVWRFLGVVDDTAGPIEPFNIDFTGDITDVRVTMETYSNTSPPVVQPVTPHDGGTISLWRIRAGVAALLVAFPIPANGIGAQQLAPGDDLLPGDRLMITLSGTGAVGLDSPRIIVGMTKDQN